MIKVQASWQHRKLGKGKGRQGTNRGWPELQGSKRTVVKIFHGIEIGPWDCRCPNVMGVAEVQMLLQARSDGPLRLFVGWRPRLKQRRRGLRHSTAQAQGALLHRNLTGHEEPAKEP